MAKPSPHELEIIQEIQERISDLELSEEYLEPKNLVRFVRARNENFDLVEDMIRKNASYYETYDMDSILRWEAPPNFADNFPWQIVGFDNLGGPIIVIPVGRWNAAAVSGNRDEFMKLNLQVFETVWGLLRLTAKQKDYIPQFNVIVDLEGFGWRQYTTYDAVQGVLALFKIFEANYPDTLRSALFVNEASVFGLFWKLLKPLMSDVTYAKMNFLGSDKKLWKKSLCLLTKPDQFPQQYGGDQKNNFKVSLDELGVYSYIFQNGNESYGL